MRMSITAWNGSQHLWEFKCEGLSNAEILREVDRHYCKLQDSCFDERWHSLRFPVPPKQSVYLSESRLKDFTVKVLTCEYIAPEREAYNDPAL